MRAIFAGMLAVFVLYMVATVFIAWWYSRGARTHKEFVLGGGRFGGTALALSERATGESAWLLLGLTGHAYADGLSTVWVALGCVIGILFIWMVMAGRLRQETERDRRDDRLEPPRAEVSRLGEADRPALGRHPDLLLPPLHRRAVQRLRKGAPGDVRPRPLLGSRHRLGRRDDLLRSGGLHRGRRDRRLPGPPDDLHARRFPDHCPLHRGQPRHLDRRRAAGSRTELPVADPRNDRLLGGDPRPERPQLGARLHRPAAASHADDGDPQQGRGPAGDPGGHRLDALRLRRGHPDRAVRRGVREERAPRGRSLGALDRCREDPAGHGRRPREPDPRGGPAVGRHLRDDVDRLVGGDGLFGLVHRGRLREPQEEGHVPEGDALPEPGRHGRGGRGRDRPGPDDAGHRLQPGVLRLVGHRLVVRAGPHPPPLLEEAVPRGGLRLADHRNGGHGRLEDVPRAADRGLGEARQLRHLLRRWPSSFSLLFPEKRRV